MWKKTFLVMVCLGAVVASGETDIFGDARNASVYFGNDAGVVDLGFTPVDKLDWGLRTMITYDNDNVDERQLIVDNWLVGVFVKYPFLDFSSVFPKIPIEGTTFAGVSLLYDLQSDNNFIVVPEIGVDVEVTENISARVAWQYTQRETIFDDNNTLMAGFVVRW